MFSSDCKLSTLKEIEEYIKNEGHLPEIPSALEVKSNGISLGDINTKLLQKIEELTFYMIQKDKEIKKLNNRVLEMEMKIK